ncbi:MAG: ABC transporter permease subunit [Kiritimatiellae bacterium]|nr:ABC transporter permease subunit [Kiritimatiellia bacterium]
MISRRLIAIGGMGTIIAVSTVMVFLVYVAAPLLKPSRTEARVGVERPDRDEIPAHVELDEYGQLCAVLGRDGRATVFSATTGRVVSETLIFSNETFTAAAFVPARSEAMFGFADGRRVPAFAGFRSRIVSGAAGPEPVQSLNHGEASALDSEWWLRLPDGSFRVTSYAIELREALTAEIPSPVVVTDFVRASGTLTVFAYFENGRARLERVEQRKNMLTGKITERAVSSDLTFDFPVEAGAPEYAVLSELGDHVLLIWTDGMARRYALRDGEAARIEERSLLLPGDGDHITAAIPLLGRATILVGTDAGCVRAWFPSHVSGAAGGPNVSRLVSPAAFEGPDAPVTALSSSARIRAFVAGYGDGSARVYHVTSGKRMAELEARPGVPNAVRAVRFTPKDDAIARWSGPNWEVWAYDPRHPEATLRSLFGQVWYESAPAPAHVWQSSSGTDDFEPKLGLIPLIFGTLKATVFSLLFGVPVALLAAIYTSEFMVPRWRARVKPAVEMMASLPSVVLGFLAAIVFAPLVADRLPMVLAAMATIPLCILAGAYLWQMLPAEWTRRYTAVRIAGVFFAILAGLGSAFQVGSMMERLCFAGDIIRWLDGQIGSASGGWMVFLFPVAALAAGIFSARVLDPMVRRTLRDAPRAVAALADAVKFIVGLGMAVALAAVMAITLQALGFDPRGLWVGTYVQRNALVVGFVMGFAVIPIIYTIAEDALSSVPEHLRSASLGCGATPWQTAVRVVIPTAMSGLFSALMIGLGRAVGETMIVLMAAGNTPVMEWNPFNGFRTLSANIAVELPEAVRNSTHYRTLFLAALVLFVLTFVLNTVAELIRIRFRRKAVEL